MHGSDEKIISATAAHKVNKKRPARAGRFVLDVGQAARLIRRYKKA
jgi:hypothetical protein